MPKTWVGGGGGGGGVWEGRGGRLYRVAPKCHMQTHTSLLNQLFLFLLSAPTTTDTVQQGEEGNHGKSMHGWGRGGVGLGVLVLVLAVSDSPSSLFLCLLYFSHLLSSRLKQTTAAG